MTIARIGRKAGEHGAAHLQDHEGRGRNDGEQPCATAQGELCSPVFPTLEDSQWTTCSLEIVSTISGSLATSSSGRCRAFGPKTARIPASPPSGKRLWASWLGCTAGSWI